MLEHSVVTVSCLCRRLSNLSNLKAARLHRALYTKQKVDTKIQAEIVTPIWSFLLRSEDAFVSGDKTVSEMCRTVSSEISHSEWWKVPWLLLQERFLWFIKGTHLWNEDSEGAVCGQKNVQPIGGSPSDSSKN